MHIRQMTAADLPFAASLTAGEGWVSEVQEDFEGFLQHDPGGCFIAEEDGERIGMCVGTPYGESAFLGELIVVAGARGRGVGARLTQHTLDYLRERGARNVLLDGVQAAVPLYERLGFRKLCPSLRFVGTRQGAPSPDVRAMQAADLGAVAALDREAFGADRGFFLKRRWALHPTTCQVMQADGQIVGFIMGRRRPGLVAVGPWVARRGVPHPARLLDALAAGAGGVELRLGVLEAHVDAVALIRALGFAALPTPPWRMVWGPSGRLAFSDQLFAVGSPAKG